MWSKLNLKTVDLILVKCKPTNSKTVHFHLRIMVKNLNILYFLFLPDPRISRKVLPPSRRLIALPMLNNFYERMLCTFRTIELETIENLDISIIFEEVF